MVGRCALSDALAEERRIEFLSRAAVAGSKPVLAVPMVKAPCGMVLGAHKPRCEGFPGKDPRCSANEGVVPCHGLSRPRIQLGAW